MNQYISVIYRQRKNIAERCRLRVVELQDQIIQKSEASLDDLLSYPSTQRHADINALDEACDQLKLALRAVIALEDAERDLS